MTTVDFIYFDAGGGHRAAATALKSVIEAQKRPWEVRLVNLQDLLDPIDLARELTGLRLQDVYNLLLKKGWTLGSAQLCRLMQLAIRAYHPKEVSLLEKHWERSRPDLAVSLVPHFNRAIYESLRNVLPGTPFVTILTDLVDYPPHFWIEPQPQYLICGTDKAVEQARAMGYSEDRVFRVSGMIISPRFYEPIQADRAEERKKLGLDPALTTGLVLFGGEGSRAMVEIFHKLDSSDLPLQLILICGRNQGLAEQLKASPNRKPRFIEGYTTQVPYYMFLSDFMIGKPGPGSISEAMAMKLPVIVQRNAATLPQERYNAEWVLENEVGLVVSSFGHIVKAVEKLIEPSSLAHYKANTARIQNRAVFEIPDILEKILKLGPPARHGAGNGG